MFNKDSQAARDLRHFHEYGNKLKRADEQPSPWTMKRPPQADLQLQHEEMMARQIMEAQAAEAAKRKVAAEKVYGKAPSWMDE
jgi:hypothetical protein